ncbi:glycosyltransferase family 2 protein [Halomonas sp. Mc5H-6]|uniref:glycosyltransferase family 2 protein n=1 Tax=Halomonas sp. Mc5H-6 TaxID=2954500 RepID=UPI00209801C1|nr:glycosyltransferase family 2 protein [Halomonas sp. Mc5H-6]MCO7246806.1 glycosyltransferase [Halomonas sp. Mc5H-6]
MITSNYSTTRRLTTDKPSCFETSTNGPSTSFKTPEGKQKFFEGGLRTQGWFKIGSYDKPVITVVTVVYNGAQFLEDTIKSVIEQSYDNVEYIIVDGGSTDGTLDVIRKYEGAIDYWVSEADKGIYHAMNKGIELGSGDWFNFMNAGDTFFSSDLFSCIIGPSINEYDLIYGDLVIIDGGKKNLQSAKSFKLLSLFFWSTRVACHQAVFVNKNVIPFYDTKYKLKSELDWYFSLLANKAKVKYFNMPICQYLAGGVSEQNFSIEMKETVAVLFRRNPFLVFLHFPVFSYKIFRRIFL